MAEPVGIPAPIDPKAPRPLARGRDNLVGRASDHRKLNGQFFTPAATADSMVAAVAWPFDETGGTLLDPCCGDGAYLAAAVRRVLASELSDAARRRIIRERIRGWDVDPAALADCTARLTALLQEAGMAGVLPRIEHRDALDGLRPGERFACVVTNPPYLEAKRMPDALKLRIRQHCPSAGRGSFDLYGAFVELAARWTDEICLLIPNRFLVARYAAHLRADLLSGWRIDVTDLSRDDLFGGAQVYPIVLHARRSDAPCYSVQAQRTAPLGDMLPLAPADPAGAALFARLMAPPAGHRIGDVADIRWTVSFHRAGLRDGFIFDQRPASPHARRFLGGGRFAGNAEVRRYRIQWGGSWIDYDAQRARDAGNPLPDPSVHLPPKAVICQNVRRARVALDTEGLVLKDTLLSMRLRAGQPGALLPWLVMVLNSDVLHYLYEHAYAGTRKGGAYLHFLGRYLDPFPFPPPPAAQTVTALYDRLVEDPVGAHDLAEEAVGSAWGVTPEEAEVLAAYPMPPVG